MKSLLIAACAVVVLGLSASTASAEDHTRDRRNQLGDHYWAKVDRANGVGTRPTVPTLLNRSSNGVCQCGSQCGGRCGCGC